MGTVYFKSEVCVFWALLVMTQPLPWLLSAALAALCHELSHLFAVWMFGGTVSLVSIGIGGAEIAADIEESKGRILAVLAGPLGSLLLVSFWRWQPRLAVCGLIQGIYNLLPVRPLDGGRIFGHLLEICCPNYKNQIQTVLDGAVMLAVVCLTGYFVSDKRLLLALLIPLFSIFRRKIPCKPG